MDEACDLPATAARAAIGRKSLSPVELVESCISRIEAVDHAVNAMVTRDFARARAAARVAERAVLRGEALGALHGLPLAVKDLEDVAGLRTTYGSLIYRDHVPERDEAMVAGLRAAGAIVIGKTNTPEFGAGGNTRNAVHGATGNPFDPRLSAAGSSGGSAVALATGMAPLATGSDLGGSLRNPAAFCGVVGFRPSAGLVPSERRALGFSGLSVLGPMARDVADLALLFAAMAREDGRDPLSTALRGAVSPLGRYDLAGARVAFTADFGFAPTAAPIAEVFAEKAARFRAVFAAAPDAHPDCAGADGCFAILRAVSFLAGHAGRTAAERALLGRNTRANLEEAAGYGASDVARAEIARTLYYRRWQAFFADFEFLISPAITIGPRPWTEWFPTEIDGRPTLTYYHWMALAYAVTLSGHPALVLPVGRDRAGLPFGLQIVGRRGRDADLLAFAAALEALLATDPRTARPRPDLGALRLAPPISASPDFLGGGGEV